MVFQGAQKHTREGGLGKDSPETEETGLGSRDDASEAVVEWLISPVAESTAIVVGGTTKVNNKTHDDQADDGDNFDGRED
jgi:hypothetical protein